MGLPRLIPAKTSRLASLVIFCLALAAGPIRAATDNAVRLTAPLDEGWAFRFGDGHEAAALAGTTADWESVRVPHTWNAKDGADGGDNYARGNGWYVRHFGADPAWAGRRVFAEFEGVNRSATVYLNGRKIGEHVGGYARFRFDLTEALVAHGENILAVRVNNADDGTAPVTADFTFFGGIYRAARIFAVDPLHVEVMDYASSGVFVTAKRVSAARADVSVAVLLRNDSAATETARVRVELRDAGGRPAGLREKTCEVVAGGTARCDLDFDLKNPRLWQGRKDPHQYTATVTVLAGGRVRDAVAQRFGVRAFNVDADKGFFLNGEYLDLHGVNRHQDRAGQGWAISPEDEREDFALIEEIGATAIRVAHYQQSPLWYDLADEHGLVVWAEIPVVNEVLASPVYLENARQQLRELIRQNYNRPAICFWGVGNETREVGETSGRAAVNGVESDRVIAELAHTAKIEDPTRPSTYASHHRAEDKRNFHAETLAFNKYFGWYGGKPEDFAGWADDVHKRYPALRFGMSEYGAGANPAHHDLSLKKPVPGGPWHPEEYQAYYHEVHWLAMRERPYLWGKFIWNMFDFAADIRAEGEAPGMNDKGLVSYDRKTRKDAFYFYKASWNPAPMVYIAGRRFAERPVGETEIKVYANGTQVELFLNGASCGTVASDTRIFRWKVNLAAGANRIEALAAGLNDFCTITGIEAAPSTNP